MRAPPITLPLCDNCHLIQSNVSYSLSQSQPFILNYIHTLTSCRPNHSLLFCTFLLVLNGSKHGKWAYVFISFLEQSCNCMPSWYFCCISSASSASLKQVIFLLLVNPCCLGLRFSSGNW